MEREPTYQFPWKCDAEGEYLIFRVSDDTVFEIRDDNSLLYLFPGESEIDHVFIPTHEDEDCWYGYRLWRRDLDEVLGKGAFTALCDQMFDKGFEVAPDEEPSELDIKCWEERFGENYRAKTNDTIVALAVSHLDEEWKYYDKEWHEDL